MTIEIVKDIKQYSLSILTKDLIAALTVTVVLVPQGMAYSMLAGLPPIYGLYAGLVPMIVYPLFGSSRTLSVGPVALMSIILLSGTSAFAEPGSQEYIDLILLTAIISGLLQIGFSALKMGVLANFLSKPVLTGFISAAGVIIAVSQIKYLLTLDIPRSASVPEMIVEVSQSISGFNLYSLVLGVTAIAVIVLLKKIHRSIPAALIVVVLGSLVLYYFNMQQLGVPIVGELPHGLPNFYICNWNWSNFITLMPSAFIVSIMCFIGSFAIAKSAEGDDDSGLDANKELFALGLSKLVGGFFLSMPTTGSFTRSVINKEAGAQTGISSIISAILIGLTLMFFGFLFYYLPEPILAAIVITSVFSLLNLKEAKYFYKLDKADFRIFLGTFVLTLIFGIVNGIILGIAFSLLSIVRRAAVPRYAVLGELPGTGSFRDVTRYEDAVITPEVLIIRYDQDLFFGNADRFVKTVLDEVKMKGAVKWVIINGRSFRNVDSTSLGKLAQLIDRCKKQNIELVFTDLTGSVRDLFFHAGIIEKLGKGHLHLRVADAMDMINHHTHGDAAISNEYAQQTNFGSGRQSLWQRLGFKSKRK